MTCVVRYVEDSIVMVKLITAAIYTYCLFRYNLSSGNELCVRPMHRRDASNFLFLSSRFYKHRIHGKGQTFAETAERNFPLYDVYISKLDMSECMHVAWIMILRGIVRKCMNGICS
jgi:hypothetical protein